MMDIVRHSVPDNVASCWFFFMNYTEVLVELLPIHSEYTLNFCEIVQLFIPEASIFYILNAIQDIMLNQNHTCVVWSANSRSVKYVVSHEVEPIQ
jgi:hypothetical protein